MIDIFNSLSTAQWVLHLLLLGVNLGFFFGASRLIKATSAGNDYGDRVAISRALSALICMLVVADLLVISLFPQYSKLILQLVYSLMTVYLGMVFFQLSTFYSLRRFGRTRPVDDGVHYFETYSSRLMNIVLAVLIGSLVVYTLIKFWGADSMLETTGIFGIIFAFLAFTSSHWAPDVMSGLMMLNSQSLESGDLVRIDGYEDEFIISKVSFIYSVLFDIRNNNRTVLRNSRLLQGKIDNLSRIASTDGIRRYLQYKIGYPDLAHLDRDERMAALDDFQKRINRMFSDAFEASVEHDKVHINPNKHFEWAMTDAGDFALVYTLWIYLDKIPDSKLTATLREFYLGTVYKVNELVFRASIANNIDLSTPDQSIVQLQQSSPAGAQV